MTDSVLTSTLLAPDYYLRNFIGVLNWVEERYTDLLSEQEKVFIRRFFALPYLSQCLYVRLAGRKGLYFRADKLTYPEIISIADAASDLISADFLRQNPLLNLDELARLLTRAELLALLAHLEPERYPVLQRTPKALLVEQLRKTYRDAKAWQEWMQLLPVPINTAIYWVNHKPVIHILLILFFGNTRQSLAEFVLQDLGLFRYESYPINLQDRIFKTRAELDTFLALAALRTEFETAVTTEQLTALVGQLPPAMTNPFLNRRRARLCNDLAYALEKRGLIELALNLYQSSHLHPARERRIRLLDKLGLVHEAWTLIEALIAQPSNEQERQVALRIATRIAKKAAKSIAIPKVPILKEQHLSLPFRADTKICIEHVVRNFYHREKAPCFYVENHLLCGLFGLWLWPEMFRGVDGAFANPFQAAPLDLYHDDFIQRRPGLKDLFSLLDKEQHHQTIRHHWQQKSGIVNHFVDWQLLQRELLDLALICLPGKDLKAIFTRLLADLRNNRSGFPDLVQFFPDKRSYRFIEVKGPGDRLQDNQRRWLYFFAENGIPAEVCYVTWQ